MKVLLTGGTGFLGQYLIAELLRRGHTVWTTYRSEEKRIATMRFLCGLGLTRIGTDLFWKKGSILEIGDQWRPWNPGRTVLQEIDTLIHCAASTRLQADNRGDPWKTNVRGSGALLSLLQGLPIKLHFVSTAYVCGRVRGKLVHEVRHPRGEFVNAYEESKWAAEEIWTGKATIIRPGIIVGDTETGRCRSFGGWYLLVQAAQLHARIFGNRGLSHRKDLGMELPADPDGSLNLVPVDYVAKATTRIIENTVNHGKIFHLTHPAPLKHQRNLDFICERFNLGGIKLIGQGSRIPEPANPVERLTFKQMKAILPHFLNNPLFDRTNTDRALPDLKIAPIDESFMNKLVDFALASDWGADPPTPPHWFETPWE